MTKDEKILSRFVNEPTYRKRVIEQLHKEQDAQYTKRIKVLKSEKEKLISKRKKEIERIETERWESVANGKLLINTTEGKVRFNKSEFLFSDIKGAEINIRFTNNVVTDEKGASKKHASLGGGVLGGLVGGVPGAIIGGVGLGKKKTKATTTQTEIPMCNHIGVLVDINGFVSEIVLLSEQVEESSSTFDKTQMVAQEIISKLAVIAKTPVPSTWLKVEDEPSVKEFDIKIIDKENEIQVAIDDKPTYKIPDMYRTEAQKDMSDEEYLSYLAIEDTARTKEGVKAPKEKRNERTSKVGAGIVPTTKNILNKIGVVCGWVLSIFTLVFVLAALIQGGIASAFIFMVSVLSINPLLYKHLKSKMNFLRKWMFGLLFLVTFIVGIVVFPTSTTMETTQILTGIGLNIIKRG